MILVAPKPNQNSKEIDEQIKNLLLRKHEDCEVQGKDYDDFVSFKNIEGAQEAFQWYLKVSKLLHYSSDLWKDILKDYSNCNRLIKILQTFDLPPDHNFY